MKLKKIREKFSREMVRPLIYATFTRFIVGMTVALAADFFLRPTTGHDLRETCFLILGFLFALMALIAWLRLDGMKLPKLMMLRVHWRKKPSKMYGDIADYLDEQPTLTFDELDDEEKDLCLLCADLICCVIFFVVSLFV